MTDPGGGAGCPRCGRPAPPGDRFCSGCGAPLAVARPVSLRKRTDPRPPPSAAWAPPPTRTAAAQPAAAAPARTTTSAPEAGRRGSTFLRVLGVVVAATGGVLALLRVLTAVVGPTTVDDPVAAAGGPPAESAPAASAEAGPVTAGEERSFSDAALRALLLEPGEVGAGGVSVDGSVPVRTLTLREYRESYSAAIEPSACGRARGLMFLSSQPAANAVAWDVPAVFRADALRIAGSTASGSQQVRQFASDVEAADFLRQQRRWFDECAHATYTVQGRSTVFDGAVDVDQVPDLLLTSADDVDPVDGAHPEFDGWARVGRVVYGTYLTGDGSTGRAEVQQAGEEVVRSAVARLQAAAQRP